VTVPTAGSAQQASLSSIVPASTVLSFSLAVRSAMKLLACCAREITIFLQVNARSALFLV